MQSKTKNGARVNPRIPVISVGFIILVAAAFLFINQQQKPAGVIPTATLAQQTNLPYPDVTRISPADAKTALDEGRALFVDVRSFSDYDADHVPGAISIPINEFESRSGELPKDQLIITYCT